MLLYMQNYRHNILAPGGNEMATLPCAHAFGVRDRNCILLVGYFCRFYFEPADLGCSGVRPSNALLHISSDLSIPYAKT